MEEFQITLDFLPEGKWWNCYANFVGSTKPSVKIGSIRLVAVMDSEACAKAFMDAMRGVLDAFVLKDRGERVGEWRADEPIPPKGKMQ